MGWKQCLDENQVIRVSADAEKARSLIEMANERISFANTKQVNEKNCTFIFEAHYTSLAEYMHALLLIEGYKVKNHLCLGFYLRDVMKREDLFGIFDLSRKRRNSIVYYGRRIRLDTSISCIGSIMELIKQLKEVIRNRGRSERR
jgi:uncharacterized protein (UPF0332 family)